jgi:membrane peptidoglycan carboxypeptidase
LGLTATLAGALVAALLLPWLAVPGWAAQQLGAAPDPLPDSVVLRAPHGNTRVLAADGSVVTEFYQHDRVPVATDQIAPVMKQAQIDIEDARFYQHGALDPLGILRALVSNWSSGEVQQGGSTLTQQLIKQTLLQAATSPGQQQAATAETLGRKINEARLAVELDRTRSKDDILTRYLNTAYYGDGAWGVQAAARTYFSTDAATLTLPQAATLAGLVQNPALDDPIAHPAAAQQRRDEVLGRMRALGHISAEQQAAIANQPVQVHPSASSPNGCVDAVTGGFFCDYLQSYLTTKLGLSPSQLRDSGLTIRTTLRPDMQAAGDAGVLATLPLGNPLAGIYTVVQPGTGHVLAMSVNRRFGCNQPDCTSVDLNVAAGQGAGSNYKVFTAASALEQGYTMDFTQTTPDGYVSRVYRNNGAPYVVYNATPNYPRTMRMAEALVMSSNTYFVGLEDHLGSVEGPVRTAQKMGLFSLTDAEANRTIALQQGSFTLGALATSPLALASAYSTVFSGGTQCDPIPVTGIDDSSGRPLTGPDGKPVLTGDHCTPDAIPAAVARTLAQVLRGDVQTPIGTATRANIPGHDIAGKTGTSQNNYSIAFVGSTPEYTASVMVYNPGHNQNVGGFGGDKGARIWHDAMLPILSQQGTAPFPPADPTYLYAAHGSGPPPSCPFTIAALQIPC